MSVTPDIVANLQLVEGCIAAACARAGRKRQDVTLVAVSKTRSVEEILVAYHAGVRHLGENRIEEAETKIPSLRHAVIAEPIVWHMIGHVQSRKARRTAELCALVHSVDSLHLAARLDRFAGEIGKRLPILLEINVSGEESKYGFRAWDQDGCESLYREAGSLVSLAHLEVRGLMAMAPVVPDPELARPVFRRLRELRDALGARVPSIPWSELSMGMTDDFEVAIEEGATIVRIGRAIFGPSTY